MIPAIQRFFGELHESACYLICLVLVACRIRKADEDEWLLAVPKHLVDLKAKGLVHFDFDNPNDNDNCLVLDTRKVMAFLLDGGFEFTYRIEGPNYQPTADEFVIEKWKRQVGNASYTHFVLPDYDPLGDSNTKRFGYLAEKRVFKVLKA